MKPPKNRGAKKHPFIRWRAFKYQGERYDLEHLHPFDFEFVQAAQKDKSERRYKIRAGFSLHCFTRRQDDNEAEIFGLQYRDSRETRIFDFDRYKASKLLPAIIKNIGERRCFHTGHDNYLIIELADRTGERHEYNVFFTLSRATQKGWLNLFVQSAYLRDQEHQNRPKPKPIRFHVIAYNTAVGKPIKEPK